MIRPDCQGCQNRDARIAQLEAQLSDLGRLQRERAFLRDESKTDRDLRLLTGESAAMKSVRLAIQQVARTDSNVLILGETGTGKELIARAIHQLSPRRDHLLVTVNCAALAPGVVASELFGHEAGAFTGATRRRQGRFEMAHQGTIFLDEIGELPAETQVLLLRVLQERSIERVGSSEPIPVDVRVIAATHRDLAASQGDGQFREDLFFRLNVFPIQVPPLRERREDIPDLVRHFLLHFNRRMSKQVEHVSPTTMAQLVQYRWPGNVRELENIIERAMQDAQARHCQAAFQVTNYRCHNHISLKHVDWPSHPIQAVYSQPMKLQGLVIQSAPPIGCGTWLAMADGAAHRVRSRISRCPGA